MVVFSGSDPLKFLTELAAKGDVVPVDWNGADTLFINSPDLIHSVLLDNQKCFVRSGGPKRLSVLLGNGLLRASREDHLSQRRNVQSAFVPNALNSYREKFIEAIERHLDKLSGEIDIFVEMRRLALSIVGRVFFSIESSMDLFPLGDALSEAIEYLSDSKDIKIFDAAVERMNRFIYSVIEKKEMNGDLVSRLIEAKVSSREQLRDEIATLLVAGFETTATALAWTLLSHARYGLPLSLPFYRGVFAEGLRLYPPAWIMFRKAVEDCVVGDLNIPRGIHVAISPYVLGRDERFFPDPERFDPSRNHETNAFIPFGLGNRRCLGENFAWMVGTETVSQFCRLFQFERVDEGPVEPAPFFTLRPQSRTILRLI